MISLWDSNSFWSLTGSLSSEAEVQTMLPTPVFVLSGFLT